VKRVAYRLRAFYIRGHFARERGMAFNSWNYQTVAGLMVALLATPGRDAARIRCGSR